MRSFLKLKILLVLTGLFILSLFFQTNFQASPKTDIVIPEPTKDFSFIKRFYCISDLFGKDQWQNNKGRSFDDEGVHLTNSKRHPVNSCHYALFCYDEFIRTGEEEYKEGFLAQVSYLLDSNSYYIIDEGSIAYPYDITFHDLKPPWYSALAQSEAISVLIRYYAYTKDKRALPVIVQLKNFMVSPQDGSCGTKSITPEGNAWYEEYPNSKQEKQVLNGFLLSTVALYEYSKLFPGDTATYRLYVDAIKTIKESFKFYDTGSWLKYNRGDQRQVANGYMKWQVMELKLLYEITADIYFKDVRMMVATYCYNKPYEAPGSKLQNYDFSIPLVPDNNDQLVFNGKKSQLSLPGEVMKVTSTYAASVPELTKMYDNNINSFSNFRNDDSVKTTSREICFQFKKKQLLGSFTISYAGLDSLEKPTVELYFKDTSSTEKWSKIRMNDLSKEVKTNTYSFANIKAQVFKVVFQHPEKFPALKVSNVAFLSPAEKVDSEYMHYATPEYSGSKDGISLNFEYKNMSDVVVFHKSAVDAKSLGAEKWNPLKTYRKFPVKIYTEKEMVHKFLIVCVPKSKDAYIGKVKAVPL